MGNTFIFQVGVFAGCVRGIDIWERPERPIRFLSYGTIGHIFHTLYMQVAADKRIKKEFDFLMRGHLFFRKTLFLTVLYYDCYSRVITKVMLEIAKEKGGGTYDNRD